MGSNEGDTGNRKDQLRRTNDESDPLEASVLHADVGSISQHLPHLESVSTCIVSLLTVPKIKLVNL